MSMSMSMSICVLLCARRDAYSTVRVAGSYSTPRVKSEKRDTSLVTAERRPAPAGLPWRRVMARSGYFNRTLSNVAGVTMKNLELIDSAGL